LTDSITIPANSDYTLSNEEVTTEIFSDQIQSTVEDTFAIKTSEELSTKLSAKVSGSIAPFAEIATEVLATMAAEMVETVKKSLTATRSYTISVNTKNSGTLVLKSGNGESPATRKFSIYIKVWEWSWDFYLYDIQYLSLKYAKRRNLIFWSDVQRTIEKSSSESPVRRPLFSLTFYEPTGSTSVVEGEYTPAIPNAQQRQVSELTKPLPDAGTPQEMKSLEAYARLAFPTTPEEEKAAKQVRTSPPPEEPPSAGGGRAPGRGHVRIAPPTRPTGRTFGAFKTAWKGTAKAKKATTKIAAKKATLAAPKKAPRVAVAKKTTPARPHAKKTSRARTARPVGRH
jgi:phage gp16-like protein